MPQVQAPPSLRSALLRELIAFDDLLDGGEAGRSLRSAAASLGTLVELLEHGPSEGPGAESDQAETARLLREIVQADGQRLRDRCWGLSSLLWARLAL